MATRQTAAARVVTDEYEIPNLIETLKTAFNEFSLASDARLAAQRIYDAAKNNVDGEKSAITERVIDLAYQANAKVSQAEIDRKVKSELFENAAYRKYDEALYQAKRGLDEASSAYEVARILHRTLVTQLNAASAALNFLASSKTARAAALASIADL